MGKKGNKKAGIAMKEKSGPPASMAASSPETVSQPSIPIIETLGDEESSVVKEKYVVCPHFDKGINLVNVSAKITSLEHFKCEDCRESAADRRASKGGKGKHGNKKSGSSALTKSSSKALWICLECGHVSCGGIGLPTTPQSHALRHSRQARHKLTIQIENPNLCWCFPCSKQLPVLPSVENREQKDGLSEIVKLLKSPPPSEPFTDVEDALLTSGSILEERGGYMVRGLANLGNTCFFNSVLQNLLAMDKLRDYFLTSDGAMGPLTVSLKNFFSETIPESGVTNVISPRLLFEFLCSKAPQFKGYQQHDSHELLRCLLDGLSAEESTARKRDISLKEADNGPKLSSTFVDAIFGGQILSTVSCLECGHASIVYEPFLDLSLPLRTKKSLSKKAPAVSRAKINRDSDSSPANCNSNLSTGDNACQIQSIEPIAEKKEPSPLPDDSSCLDYIDEPDANDMASHIDDESSAQDSGNGNEVVQNPDMLNHNSELINDTDHFGSSWEDELSIQVEGSEVLLLPYNEDTTTKVDNEVILFSAGNEQDLMDLGGFGHLFDEPEVAWPTLKPLSYKSESDSDEVDNTDSPASVESCLDYFLKPELLSKNEHGWICEECSKVVVEQRMRLKKVQNASDGNMERDLLGNSVQSLVLTHGKCDNGHSCIASGLVEGMSETNGGPPELSESSSSYKTCCEESFSGQTGESSSVPGHTGCQSDEVGQQESQLLGQSQTHESKGSSDEEIDSGSLKITRDATKRVLINRAPPILTIHLKRFSQDARGRLSKLNGHVNFNETIDFGPYINPSSVNGDKHKYRLVGVVEHLGTMRGGHYVAYVRGGAKSRGKTEIKTGNSVWYHASDSYVRVASLEEVLRCEAYILFYEEM